jgi:DNA-binding CsgD family transcriptional regulator
MVAQAPEEALHSLYGLSQREARMASELMQGRSLDGIAESLHIAKSTARTHLLRIFAKTGTSRQGELVSLLLRTLR